MRQLYGAALAAGVGLMVMAAPAHAITLTATPQNPPLASGTYRVVINQTGPTTYSVVVSGNNDGRTTPGASLEPVKSSVGNVSIGFLTPGGTYVPVDAGSTSGGTTTGGGFVGAPYQQLLDPTIARFRSPSKSNDIAPFGGNAFTGSIALGSAVRPDVVTVALQDGSQQWFAHGRLGVVPEPGSLALVLPGLAPLALVLLRRRPLRRDPDQDPDQEPSS